MAHISEIQELREHFESTIQSLESRHAAVLEKIEEEIREIKADVVSQDIKGNHQRIVELEDAYTAIGEDCMD